MASSSFASVFNGMACPNKLSYGKVHGPSPAVGSIELEGSFTTPLGQVVGVQAGSSGFIGFVTKAETRQDEVNGEVTSIRLVDWRDRLHDNYVYAAWNMQEEDGRFWHILEEDWLHQRKVWIARPLGQQDFSDYQNIDPALSNGLQVYASGRVFSAATLLKYLAYRWSFKVSAEQHALDILTRSYPTNIDFNAGVRVVEAVDTILRRCGLQFTCFGYNRMHITLRGYSDNMFVNALANGYTNICLNGASNGSFGYELNDKGRRVHVIGGPNKYEFIYPCRIDWNPAFTFELCFGGWPLSALLQKHSLTLASKLGELPEKFHDSAPWNEGDVSRIGATDVTGKRTRNEMTIEDYINRFCYKSYVVDFAAAIVKMETNTGDEIKGQFDYFAESDTEFEFLGSPIDLKDYDRTGDWPTQYNSYWPLSRSLVSNSNLQYQVYASSQKMVRGEEDPFGKQSSLVPLDKGGSLSVDEILFQDEGKPMRAYHQVRITFNEPQFHRNMELKWDDPKQIEPDYVLVQLSVDKELYAKQFGQGQNGPKVRTQKVTLRNLYRGFVNGEERSILQRNFISNMEDSGAVPASTPVKADEIASRVAWQALFHQYVNRAGNLHFDTGAGFEVDGLIDSVNISFSDSEGVQEDVNFTSDFMDDENNPSFSVVKVSTFLKTEDEIIRDRLVDYAKKAAKDASLARKAMDDHDKADSVYKGIFGAPTAAKSYGHDGVVAVKVKHDVYTVNSAKPGHVLLTSVKTKQELIDIANDVIEE